MPDSSVPIKTPVDPLGSFIDCHRATLEPNRGNRFNAGEHAWLASVGAKEACEFLEQIRGIIISPELFDSIKRRDGKEELQYGELVALSGDFYKTPEELFDEKSTLFNIPGHDNDLDDLRQIITQEMQWINAHKPGDGSTYPDENIRLAWNAKSYVELALDNTDHFGWHNLRAYCRYHAEALRLAIKARTYDHDGETFRRALYTNAFADHFLTDGFAAGHIRVPRAEIRAWAKARGLDEKVAGSLSKLLHDQDGHINMHSLHGVGNENGRDPNDGLWVMNSNGDTWYTYCDGQLFLKTRRGNVAVDQAVEAVTASVIEFLLAWKLGDIPRGVYEATRWVPFPHPDAPSLVEKFPANMPEPEFNTLFESIPWYQDIPWITRLERGHVRDLFRALPEIMAHFRSNVAATAAADPEIGKRIPKEYIDAYKKIA